MPQHLYAVAFDNGQIKVGRSDNPARRILQHADRVSVAGIAQTQAHFAECDGEIQAAERELITRCAQAGKPTPAREWFDELSFDDVCSWIDEITERYVGIAQSPLNRAIDAAGGLKRLADAIGATAKQVNNWRLPHRQVPASVCPSIERATNRVVRCEDMRPDVDWAYVRGTAAVVHNTTMQSTAA